MRSDGGGDQGLSPVRVENRNQHLRRSRQRQDQEADYRAQGISSDAGRPGRGPRRRSALPFGALCGRNDGSIPAARKSAGLHYLGVPVQHQMRAILSTADDICRAGGTSLDQCHACSSFCRDQYVVYPALRIWQDKLAGAAIPFGAVRTPDCPFLVVMSLWICGRIGRAVDAALIMAVDTENLIR